MPNILCTICMRAGSKGVVNKNLKLIILISYVRRWAEGEGKTIKHKLIALNIPVILFLIILGII